MSEREHYWHVREDGTRFRNIPSNHAERKALLEKTMTWRRHRKLLRLEAEFEVLWEHGIIESPANQ